MTTAGQRMFLERISALSKEERFGDIQLEFSDGNRKFNRLVLASLSPFFDAMLSSAMKEGLSGVVKLPTVSSDVFDAVMAYYLEGKGELNEEGLYEAVDAAEMMELPDLKDVCIRNMSDNLTPTTCLRIWQLSQKYTCDQALTDRAMGLIVDNFHVVHKQTEFFSLPQTDILHIIRARRYKILQEKCDFDAVMKWIDVNRPDEAAAKSLFNELRLRFLQPRDILKKTFQYRDVLNKYKAIERSIEEYAVDGKSDCLSLPNKNWTPKLHNVIIVCSSSSKSVLRVSAWHLNRKRWYDLPTDISKPIEDFAAAASGFSIVVTGGISDKVVKSETRILDTFTAQWKLGPDLVAARCRHGSVSVGESVYVLGGYNTSHLNTIEKLSAGHDQWETVGNLFTAVAEPSVQSCGQYILVMGGKIKTNKGSGIILTIQCFNVESRSTTVVGSLPGTVITSAMSFPYIYLFVQKHFPIVCLSLLHIRDTDDTVTLEWHKEGIALPKDLGFWNGNLAFSVVDGVGILYRSCTTREINVTYGGDSQVALPTVPGNVKTVQCAFQTVLAERCLLENTQ